MDKANTCYLSSDNLCFTLAGMNKHPEQLKDRILSRRNELQLSQAQLADKAGVSQVTIQHLESGRNATSKRLVEIGEALGVSAEWLKNGSDGASRVAARGIESNVVPGPPITSPLRRIAIVGTAQMGPDGHWVALDDAGGWIEAWTRDEAAYALELRGDSMAPAIRNGWVAICEPGHRLVPGEYVMVTTTDGDSMVKELLFENPTVVSLMSLNSGYDRVTLQWKDIDTIHYVAAIMGPSKIQGRI
ncbi:XRE family transcriptional regulator [Pseudomonas sp. NPDC090202]|uniref:XRE family transcriptional regulator n=1 Tax=Pseudomonas sp. NPDC090202 TaxID=3364476 RepID=UPI003806360B